LVLKCVIRVPMKFGVSEFKMVTDLIAVVYDSISLLAFGKYFFQ